MKVEDVAVFLSVRPAQVYAMIRSGDLPAVKLGGRGIWRVDKLRLEAFLDHAHEETARWIKEHPHAAGGQPAPPPEDDEPDGPSGPPSTTR